MNIFLQVVTEIPTFLEDQSILIKVFYLLGGMMLMGMTAALYYLSKQLDKKDSIIEKKDAIIEKKEGEIKGLVKNAIESDKANLLIMQNVLNKQGFNSDVIKEVIEMLREKIKPTVNNTDRLVKEIANKLN